ncbi:MAG: DUF2240 family protein [Candidatus Methanomethylophilaceae archaeon]|nr:DUF2240 family protein [Candidatus Methanomethylophilaceae archaeon]
MTDEPMLCAAAFFRNKGKGVVTEKEFLMGISMDFRWMPYSDAKELLSALLAANVVKRDGDLIRPAFDVADADVPVAYRPPADLIRTAALSRETDSMNFPQIIAFAEKHGMKKKDFISASNALQKKLGISPEAAGLIVLRDNGTDISEIAERVYTGISGE